MKDKAIYILGAGCSANYGYPLAKEFCGALKEYRLTLDQRPNCEGLLQCVSRTVKLMETFHSPTVDRLVLRILEELGRQKRPLSPYDGTKHEKLEQSADRQILDAKIATVTLFIEREDNARKTGLQGYRDFLNIIFDGNRNPDVLKAASSRVLSFNYDRLFEIAFIDYFRLDSSIDCYGQPWLNAGFDFFQKQAVVIAPDRFCFLKLHGTAGISVAEQDGQRQYGSSASLQGTNRVVDDSLFWSAAQEPSFHSRVKREPMIVFPCEKDRARENRTFFLYDNYVRAIWGQAMQLAEEARQIWVIGYSFDPGDRKSILEVLGKNRVGCEIVIQNPDEEAICGDLQLRNRDLARRLKPLARPF